MIFAGLQKLSLVDFPGKLAAVIFLQGCNFRCGYCQNPDLIKRGTESGVREEEILGYLACRKAKLDAVVITGGEPTIHEDLTDLIRKLSLTGLKIKLDTNGSHPAVLKDLLREGLLDYVAVDVKTSFLKYDLVSPDERAGDAAKESVKICLGADIPYEFRTTCVPGIVEKPDFHAIGEAVKGARKYCLQQFRPGITYDRMFGKVEPFSPNEVKCFADILSGYVEEVELRGF
ncbi:MAG: anaerobic ribonucleoside-triphosphate reductase activating protein [Candidatus Omnitrophota bacterium]